MLELIVAGTPRPQGSLRMFQSKNGHTVAKYADRTIEHRNWVITQLRDAWSGRAALGGPVLLIVTFSMPRPGVHFGTGKNRGKLKESAPANHILPPDLDKLTRLIGDAAVLAGVLRDDSQIVGIEAIKVYSEVPGDAGCTAITIKEISE